MNRISNSSVEQLSEAFAEFEDASRELSGFYRDLEQQVALLTRELSHSREQRLSELAEKERLAARMENLLQALPGGIVVLDQSGLVQEFNPVAADLLGPLIEGEAWGDVVARAFAPRFDDGHDVSLADGRLVNIATQALSGEPGQILLLKDVTDTRRLQDQLAHHKRLSAKTEMAAAMAHQIRTPLASALLSIGNVARAPNAEFRERAVERSLVSLRKLERLVDDMLLFARGGRFEVASLSVDELFAALESAIAESFDHGESDIEFAAPATNATIFANLAALISVSLNLIENSHQATGGQGHIRIEGCCGPDRLEIRFVDDGPGIEAALHEQVFEPFHSKRSNGTGLGLSVARAVARAHGGDLELENSGPGACFVMHLPLVEIAVDSNDDAASHTPSLAMAE